MILAALASATVLAAGPTITVQQFGMGASSCATYRASAQLLEAGDNWILGYWTGMNHGNDSNHLVGEKTDARGLIAEIRKVCDERPSATLADAAKVAYDRVWVAEGAKGLTLVAPKGAIPR